MPDGFGEFEVERWFRGAKYTIEVQNPDNVQKGVQSVTVDGQKITGNVIPFAEGKKEYRVVVVMG